MDKKFFEGVWVVATGSTGKYVGKLRAIGMHKVFSDDMDAVQDEIMAYLATNGNAWAKLSPVYDFLIYPEVSERGFLKIPFVTSVDVTFEACPLYIKVETLMFFHEMSEEDQTNYRNLVLRAEDMHTKKKVKANDLITLVPPYNERQ